MSAAPALDKAFAAKVKAAKLKLYVWTVNDLEVAKRMVEIGVDGITTDRPGLAARAAGRAARVGVRAGGSAEGGPYALRRPNA